MNLMSKDISDDFSDSKKIYLNNASVSLMPSQSIDAMKEFLITYNSIGPDSNDSESFVFEKLQNVRKIMAKIISCHPEEVVLTQSTTDGINFVANGISFDKESNMIIRGMGHEHHANFYPWLKLGEKILIKNLSVDNNGFFQLDDLKSFVDRNTKLVSLSHALYNTGSILPVEEVGRILHNKVPFFIDGDGNIRIHKRGPMEFSEMKEKVESILSGMPKDGICCRERLILLFCAAKNRLEILKGFFRRTPSCYKMKILAGDWYAHTFDQVIIKPV
mgnify:CR=1 FL=1